jgi:uncharacterized protein (TIGR03083 family)
VQFLRVDVRGLLPPLRAELVVLLGNLSAGEWNNATACPAWSVHGITSHLLGVEVGNVSIRRDHWGLEPGPNDDPDVWLDDFNQQWVDAARRISPALLMELLDIAGRRFEEHVATLDLDAIGGPVEWATGSQPAPVWLDIAREYMERFVHQYQIRAACGRPQLAKQFSAPVVQTAVHALPLALARISRPAGTVVTFSVDGDQDSAWDVIYTPNGWELGRPVPGETAACEVRTTIEGAIRSFIRDPDAPAFTWRGDHELAAAVSQAKAIIGQ